MSKADHLSEMIGKLDVLMRDLASLEIGIQETAGPFELTTTPHAILMLLIEEVTMQLRHAESELKERGVSLTWRRP